MYNLGLRGGEKDLKKIAVLFSGAGSNLEYILTHLHKREGIEVVVALTNRANAGGIKYALDHQVPLEIIESKSYENRESFDEKVVQRLHQYDIDLTVLAGFMRIVTPIFTEQIRAINLHPSLLPRHKGLQAIERSYADDYSDGGVSVHWVTSQLDGGDIILQKKVAKDDLSFEAYELQIKTIEKIALAEAIQRVLTQNMQ